MRYGLIAMAVLAASPALAQQRPQTMPTRDVDITYRITRAGQTLTERTRWLAAQEVQRIEPPGNAMYMLMDHRAHHASMVDDQRHSVVDMALPPHPSPLDPGSDAQFTRRGDDTVAGLACTNWETSSGGAPTTLCFTADGALLRVRIGGTTLVEAVTVSYSPADPAAFAAPAGYEHVVPPQGGPVAPSPDPAKGRGP